MADPLSASGVALSAVSLAFQIFSGCIKGYELLIEAQGLPKKYEYLKIRLQLEESRLLDWAVVVKLSDTDDAITGPWQIGQATAMEALKQMETLLLDLGKLSSKFNLTLVECLEGESDIDKTLTKPLQAMQQVLKHKALNFVAKARSYPERLRWVVFKGDKFELLLSRITALNDSMLHFLDSHQKLQHYEVQENTFIHVLQVQNRLDDLMRLVQSLGTAPAGPSERTAADYRHAELARFKALTLTINDDCASSTTVPLDSNFKPQIPQLVLLTSEKLCLKTVDDSTQAPLRSLGTYNSQAVWAEWKYYAPTPSGSPHAYVEDRISRLALLLKHGGSHSEFSTPNCLGYIHQPQALRLGLVFEALGDPTTNTMPVPLRYLVSTTPKPPLTVRIRLAKTIATSLWYLHAANWVHKGVRSDNILFRRQSDLSSPLLAGFDYARPSKPGEVTDLGVENREHELYRHPDVQFDVPRDGKYGFKKAHDVYSLGVVLFEIGLWESVESYLGVPTDGQPEISRPQVKSVQSRLLSGDAEYRLSAEAGDIFTKCVMHCLDNDIASSPGLPGYRAEEGSFVSDFEGGVLQRLRSIKI